MKNGFTTSHHRSWRAQATHTTVTDCASGRTRTQYSLYTRKIHIGSAVKLRGACCGMHLVESQVARLPVGHPHGGAIRPHAPNALT